MVQGQSFTGADLEKALKDNTLIGPGIALTGMVKTSEKAGHVRFTRSGCEGWVDLPIAMIEKAEYLGNQPCKDHAHPVMRLTLRESKDPLAQILMALLSQSGQTASSPTPPSSGFMEYQTGGIVPMDSGFQVPTAGYPPADPYGGAAARIAGGVGLPDTGGGLNAWGCWKARCCKTYGICGGPGGGPGPARWCCKGYEECTRCIWPW